MHTTAAEDMEYGPVDNGPPLALVPALGLRAPEPSALRALAGCCKSVCRTARDFLDWGDPNGPLWSLADWAWGGDEARLW